MGKAGRVACIATPMLLTIASFICLILIEVSGWDSSSATLDSFYFLQVNFTDFSVANAGDLANSTTLTEALQLAKSSGSLADVYQIHLWNYCTQNTTTSSKVSCTPKHAEFYFNPVIVWGLNATTTAAAEATSTEEANVFASYAAEIKNNTEQVENEVLGKSGADALDAYREASKWMFIAYEVSFWTTLATIVFGILAVCSRWGSFLTWILSIVSSLFTLGAVLTSTILFSVLLGALDSILHPYNIKLSLGSHALALIWLAVAFSWAATLFWLFSVCCCSGRSNPHHRTNKGGLWDAEPKGQGYGAYYDNAFARGGRRGVRVEKTGGAYERVGSPFIGGENSGSGSNHKRYYFGGAGGSGDLGDRVPLQDYPAPQAGFPGSGAGRLQGGGYEPYRHS